MFDDLENEKNLQSKITAKYIIKGLDPIALVCLYEMSLKTKSAAVSLCLLSDHITIEKAMEVIKSHRYGVEGCGNETKLLEDVQMIKNGILELSK